jgi:hypothetical protein
MNCFIKITSFICILSSTISLIHTNTSLQKNLDQELLLHTVTDTGHIGSPKKLPLPMKIVDTLFLIYIAADNDLRSFAIRNLKQILSIGSTEHLHIVVHLDIRDSNGNKITRRYFIEKNKYIVLNEGDPETQAMDSGDPETLISFCTMAIKNFPAKNVVLDLWDHGTGYLAPIRRGHVNPSTLFTFNQKTCKLELDRSVGYITFLTEYNENNRGVCWDQTTQNFLSAAKLDYALKTICQNSLDGERFAIIAFDACLMAMVEVADLLSPYADIMVGSEETVLGTGYDYAQVLAPFTKGTLSPHQFATHMVNSFFETYRRITQDFTLSALDLSMTPLVTQNLNMVAELLITCIQNQKKNTVKQALKTARMLCTHFNEPGYLDVHNLYTLLQGSLKKFSVTPHASSAHHQLEQVLKEGLSLMQKYAFANTAGQKLSNAHGVSIYFPERMHSSYPPSVFARSNKWFNFISAYLAA